MSIYAERRAKVLAQMPSHSIAILPGNTLIPRNGDATYPFRQNSDFYYLTGFNEPNACAVLIKDTQEFILFNQPRNPAMERWDGYRAGQEGAIKDFGAHKSFADSEIASNLMSLIQGCECLYFTYGRSQHWDKLIFKLIDDLRGKVRSGVAVPTEVVDLETIIHEMRLIKSEHELALMSKAAQISVDAHLSLMRQCQPEMYEYQLEAEFISRCIAQGARYQAYQPIIASGENSCVLHYIANFRKLHDHELLLVDAGCEYDHYASDITRTYPTNGRFSKEQSAIYELVLAAQMRALEILQPGILWPELQKNIIEIITQGLVDLKILQGDVKELIANKAYSEFYMHNSGHWLGLDVHDVGRYKIGDEWRKLKENMVLTVEPGIYIAPNTPKVDPKWYGIGVRIEDDVVVKKAGPEILSHGLPKTIAEVERAMRG